MKLMDRGRPDATQTLEEERVTLRTARGETTLRTASCGSERLYETLVSRSHGSWRPKEACGIGACGACAVHLNGVAIYSCLTFTASCRGVLSTEGTPAEQQAGAESSSNGVRSGGDGRLPITVLGQIWGPTKVTPPTLPPLPPLAYALPSTVDEAVRWMKDDGQTILLAGGTHLLPALLSGAAQSETPAAVRLVDLKGVQSLRYVMLVDGRFRLGAMTTLTEVIRHPLIRLLAPSLSDAAQKAGATPIQSMRTVGGEIVARLTDSPLAQVLRSTTTTRLTVYSPSGQRNMSFRQWLSDIENEAFRGDVALRRSELIGEISFEEQSV